jgi:hypothetical protein
MAADAALRAVTEPAYPVASHAGRKDAGVPRYIERAFTAEERHLLRKHFGIQEPGWLYLSSGVLCECLERPPSFRLTA